MATEIEVVGDDRLAIKLDGWADRLDDFITFWDDAADAFKRREEIWFNRQGEGTWPPLSPKYAKYKARVKPNRPLMVFEGTLKDVLTSDRAVVAKTPRELVLGTDVSGAGYHRKGKGVPKRDPIAPMTRLAGGVGQRLRQWARYDRLSVLA